MPELILRVCRVTLTDHFQYCSVQVLPGGVTGYALLDDEKVPVFVVDGSRQYEWAVSEDIAKLRAVEYRLW
ncbi:MAG: hypothetical protein ACRDHZ_04080 [Ktedonobacteraceae bacterium]